MTAPGRIEDLIYKEVMYRIPTALLLMLDLKLGLNYHIDKHLKVINEVMDNAIPPLFWRRVAPYVVDSLKASIFEVYSERGIEAVPDPRYAEVCSEYRDAGQLAEEALVEIKDVYKKYSLMRRY